MKIKTLTTRISFTRVNVDRKTFILSLLKSFPRHHGRFRIYILLGGSRRVKELTWRRCERTEWSLNSETQLIFVLSHPNPALPLPESFPHCKPHTHRTTVIYVHHKLWGTFLISNKVSLKTCWAVTSIFLLFQSSGSLFLHRVMTPLRHNLRSVRWIFSSPEMRCK